MQQAREQALLRVAFGFVALATVAELASGVITVQIGGATRLSSLSRSRDRYSCYWDCDLVGCQIAREDDECAYDCEKICRLRYEYTASGRSGAAEPGQPSSSSLPEKSALEELSGKSAAAAGSATVAAEEQQNMKELLGAGSSVRLHLPRNASARNFAIWERCGSEAGTGRMTEQPFNL